MTPEEVADRHPHIYHMAELDSWPSIKEHGLLSTTALLKLFEVSSDKRRKIESEWRPRPEAIDHPEHGTAVIRDQKMPPIELDPQLVDLTRQEWYKYLNGKTFFWAERKRLANFLFAYGRRPHCVLIVDTLALLSRHGSRASLCSINSGFTKQRARRGSETFKPIAKFPSSQRVWEVAIEHSVPDIMDFIVRAEEWQRDRKLDLIWERTQ